MRRIAIAIALLGVLGFGAAGCQKGGPAGLSQADEAAIREGSEAFVKGANAKAWSDLAAIYAEGAALLPPNQEAVNGRAAIQAWFEAFPPFTDFRTQLLEVYGRGDLAYVRGTYSMKLTLPGRSAQVENRGKYIEIWRKQADGAWKLVRDIFNSDLPAATAPTGSR